MGKKRTESRNKGALGREISKLSPAASGIDAIRPALTQFQGLTAATVEGTGSRVVHGLGESPFVSMATGKIRERKSEPQIG
jgi:hypothetical protein